MRDALLSLLISVEVLYGAACGVFGSRPGAPLWLRWPLPVWNLIANDWRKPPPVPKRPDYAKIERLERELGIGDGEPERPIRLASTVCLTKNCAGDAQELRTWAGALIARTHCCG